MSFDLWFATKATNANLDIRQIRDWFTNRLHYDPDGLENNQVIYENQDTGVYFTFEFGEFFDPHDLPDMDRPVEIILLLNYLRPKFFALECVFEIQALVDQFDLQVADPQECEQDYSAFDEAQFVQSFSKHSCQAVRALRENHDYEPKPISSEKLEVAWRWNFEKHEREKQTSADVFFPTIFWFEANNTISSGVVWSDGIPTVIPPCDSIYLHWDELAGRRVFGINLGKLKTDQLYDKSVLDDIFTEFYEKADSNGCLWPRAYNRPAKLTKILRAFERTGALPQMLQANAVIDDSFVDS